MGRLKLQSGIKAIEEEPEDCVSTSNRGTLACMVNSEVGAVLAVMRRNVRWGGRYMAGDDQLEHSLIQSLKALRKQIFSWQHQWHTINPAVYLQPFLDVIRSDETGAPITGVALSSVYKILTLDILDLDTVNVAEAMHLVVDAVTSCRFEVTDPASEEVVLMKILQVLLACMKIKASVTLSNQHVCTIVNTCFRVVHQAGSKGELLQRIARHTMHELVRCIFSHLPDIAVSNHALTYGGGSFIKHEAGGLEKDHASVGKQLENGNGSSENDGQLSSVGFASNASTGIAASVVDESTIGSINVREPTPNDLHLMTEPYGVPCMVEIFHFLCSLLNIVEHTEMGPRSNTITFDEDVPLFALGLINSAIELGGSSICQHPKLLSLMQDELFRNLMQFGLSMSPLILSMVCSIVLNLYHHLRAELKLQLEAFFSCVILRLAQNKYGASYQQQEVAMEALVDFCRQKSFMPEMYSNFDCDITCSNIFEDLANLLSKSAFPVNCPLPEHQSSSPPPIFRYCTTGAHFDIPFPDWSFWGWPETNIRPWDEEFRSIKQGSQALSWTKKWAHAFWKGNPDVQSPIRTELLQCNNTMMWGAEIMRQNWAEEARVGYEKSKLSNQCNHRYKIYAEGYAWSVSLKYILSCGSLALIISPQYEDFFSRGLIPRENYWPVSSIDLCQSIKFAVDWGNKKPSEAEAIGKRGQDFMENLSIDRVYDYMFHLISEYAKLQDFKPAPPSSAQEVCVDSLLCFADPKARKFLERSTASPSPTLPCTLQPANHDLIENWIRQKRKIIDSIRELGKI